LDGVWSAAAALSILSQREVTKIDGGRAAADPALSMMPAASITASRRTIRGRLVE
jgi:hypothetical protein